MYWSEIIELGYIPLTVIITALVTLIAACTIVCVMLYSDGILSLFSWD